MDITLCHKLASLCPLSIRTTLSQVSRAMTDVSSIRTICWSDYASTEGTNS